MRKTIRYVDARLLDASDADAMIRAREGVYGARCRKIMI